MPPKREKKVRPGNISKRNQRLPPPRPRHSQPWQIPEDVDAPEPPLPPRASFLTKLREREIGSRRSSEPIVFQRIRSSRIDPEPNPHHQMKTFGQFQELYRIPLVLNERGREHARNQTYSQWYDEMRALKAHNHAPHVTPIPTDRVERLAYPYRTHPDEIDEIRSRRLPTWSYQVLPQNPEFSATPLYYQPSGSWTPPVDNDLDVWNRPEQYQPSQNGTYVIS